MINFLFPVLKMHPNFVVFIHAVLLIFPMVLAGQSSCTTENQEQYIGNVFYKCVNGSLTPIACASETGKKIAIGETFETSNYEMKCMQTLSNWIQPEIVACMLNGKKVGVGDSLSDESFSYTCTATANKTVNLQLTGCVDDSGKAVKSGESFQSGNFLFKCIIDANGAVTIRGAGCILPLVNQNNNNGTDSNVQIAVGEEHMEDAFYYVCKEQKNDQGYYGVERHIAGCVNNGKKVEVGQKYTSKGYVYQCQQLEHGHVSHAVVGCVSDAGQEFSINGTWTEGQAPLKYVMQCANDGHQTMKNIVQCSYESSEGHAVLDPGCSKRVGSLLVQCLRNGANGISYRTAPANGTSTEGLKMC